MRQALGRGEARRLTVFQPQQATASGAQPDDAIRSGEHGDHGIAGQAMTPVVEVLLVPVAVQQAAVVQADPEATGGIFDDGPLPGRCEKSAIVGLGLPAVRRESVQWTGPAGPYGAILGDAQHGGPGRSSRPAGSRREVVIRAAEKQPVTPGAGPDPALLVLVDRPDVTGREAFLAYKGGSFPGSAEEEAASFRGDPK